MTDRSQTRTHRLSILWSGVWVWLLAGSVSPSLSAQIQFFSLSTADGLSDNYIYSMTVDRNGYLWIGTGSGLNRFSGKQVERFFSADYPALQSDIIRQVVCDSANRIWALSDQLNVTVIDENRHFRPVVLTGDDGPIRTRFLMQGSRSGTVLITDQGLLQLPSGVSLGASDTLRYADFSRLEIGLPDSVFQSSFSQFMPCGPDQFVLGSSHTLFVIDLIRGTATAPISCSGCRPVGVFRPGEIAVYNWVSGALTTLRPENPSHQPLLTHVKDQNHKPITGYIHRLVWLDAHKLLVNTRGNGLYLYHPSTGELTHVASDPGDPSSLLSPNPNIAAVTPTGWVFLGCTAQGVSYFNHRAVIGQQTVFRDAGGRGYNQEIGNLTSADGDTYFIAINAPDLLVWQRSTNTTSFLRLARAPDATGQYPGYSGLHTDSRKRIWVNIHGEGIAVLDPASRRVLHRIDLAASGPAGRAHNFIRYMAEDPDGFLWACTRRGLARISPDDLSVDWLFGTPLDSVRNYLINFVAWPEPGKMWIATELHGAFVVDLTAGSCRRLDTRTGDLPANAVYCINRDREGHVYVGTSHGLTIFLRDGRRKLLTTADGLLNNRVEALLPDVHDRMWFGNDVAIGCFTMADTTIRMFDERFGLSVQGFRVYAYHQNADGELIWGTERGLQYFHPDSLYHQTIDLQSSIHRISSNDLDQWLTEAGALILPPGNSFVTFHFSTIDFSKHIRTFYQYRLDDLDPEWITVTDQQTARYNSLKPGTYTFQVRASHDGTTWHPAAYPVQITLRPFFWQTPWFRLLLAGLLVGAVAALARALRQRVRRRTEELETEAIIQYFASAIHRHKETEDMLWDVARNCISRLQLEECVIYLVDADRGVLVQKAAIGPKNPEANRILNPLEIPLGKGICGVVAETGQAVLIPNTEKDPRYLIDDQRRYAEITVPIILDGQVIGVIDSEHSQKHFFTPRHLRLLKTIAVLTANQIRRNEAEAAKRRAEIEVLVNKQKAAESRLQSLRLQMNPHFLFNALNSIQQMILANEELVATRYLSRFSKLLRSVLIHSDKETISLKEELDILRLYVELESVRFKEAFHYTIEVDEDIDLEELKIPTLLIQPFVENAIWHGLMHKEGDRRLSIRFEEDDDWVACIIEDNGIGRARSAARKRLTGQEGQHTGKGIQVSLERLQAMQKNGGPAGTIDIEDLFDARLQPAGTRVIIHLPILN